MNVLIIFNSDISVHRRYLTDQVTDDFMNELIEKGHHVSLFGQFIKGETESDFKNYKVRVYGLTRKKNKLVNYIILYYFSIRYILKADFIYVYYPSSFKYIPLLCLALGKKYGIHVRGQKDLYSRVTTFFYKKAVTVLSISSEFSRKINDLCGVHKSVMIARSLIPYTEKDIEFCREYNSKKEYNLLFLARVEFDKGIDELLKAIKIVKERGYKAKLSIIGDGGYLPVVKSTIVDLGISDSVELVGPIWDYRIKAEFYKKSDIYILPSYHEGFPQTLHEAMVFGTPIITTMVGGIPSLMVDRVNCLSILPKSVESIVSALDYSFNNYPMMGSFAKNGMKDIYSIVDSSKPTHAEQLLSIIS